MVGANPFFTFFDEKQPEKSLSAHFSREQNADFPKYFEKSTLPDGQRGRVGGGSGVEVSGAVSPPPFRVRPRGPVRVASVGFGVVRF